MATPCLVPRDEPWNYFAVLDAQGAVPVRLGARVPSLQLFWDVASSFQINAQTNEIEEALTNGPF